MNVDGNDEVHAFLLELIFYGGIFDAEQLTVVSVELDELKKGKIRKIFLRNENEV